MHQRIEVSGLSCPLPVVKVREKLLEMKKGVLEVQVDNGTAKDNITRMAKEAGWKVEIQEEGEVYLLNISK
ncbi:MAG: sulfurtransferase TusA family protein [Candidatus Atribacteria bacterium]|nr:sulfurtransferase TusA family protein [Candidatus Atribacteria bacterium]